jgi:hypothetical protein
MKFADSHRTHTDVSMTVSGSQATEPVSPVDVWLYNFDANVKTGILAKLISLSLFSSLMMFLTSRMPETFRANALQTLSATDILVDIAEVTLCHRAMTMSVSTLHVLSVILHVLFVIDDVKSSERRTHLMARKTAMYIWCLVFCLLPSGDIRRI